MKPKKKGTDMKTETKKYLAALPFFPGFYESSLDALMDREMESEIEGDPPYRPAKTWEEVDKYANYRAAMEAVAKGWVQSFSQESGLKMEWESMVSPREYNFETDRVFVHLPQETLDKLKPVRESEEFAETLKKMFTSYDGFMSFYSSSVEGAEWIKPVEEWDHNQLQALIRAYVIKEVDDDPSHFRGVVEDRPCVYEAADALWTPIPK